MWHSSLKNEWLFISVFFAVTVSCKSSFPFIVLLKFSNIGNVTFTYVSEPGHWTPVKWAKMGRTISCMVWLLQCGPVSHALCAFLENNGGYSKKDFLGFQKLHRTLQGFTVFTSHSYFILARALDLNYFNIVIRWHILLSSCMSYLWHHLASWWQPLTISFQLRKWLFRKTSHWNKCV